MLQDQPNQLCYVAETRAGEGENYRIKAKQCLLNMWKINLFPFYVFFNNWYFYKPVIVIAPSFIYNNINSTNRHAVKLVRIYYNKTKQFLLKLFK